MKRLLSLSLFLMAAMLSFAHIFEVKNADGKTIYYDITSLSDLTVAVTYKGTSFDQYSNEYTGEVTIPATVIYSGKTYSVTSIGYGAFRNCSGLKSITIPNSVTRIGSSAFWNCSGLTSVTIGNSVTSIGESAFYRCSGLTSITIPNSVTSIGNDAFWACSGLTSVTIPNSVTSIGISAFAYCSGLTSVTIPNSVTSIGHNAFEGCSGLKSVTIGNSVTSIASETFYNTNLRSVTIGTGVLSISYSAFSYSDSSTGAKPVKVIWLTNTPPSGYEYVGGKVIYVANDLYTKISNKTVYPFLSSMFEVDGVKYVPVSPSERTCDAIDCVYD